MGGTTVRFSMHVKDADQTIARAIAAGATETMPASNQFYGFRSGNIRDPFGHEWMIQHRLEEVPPDEMQKRWNSMTSGDKDGGK